ncbi:MAG: helix-hairpin-helix domain-containing protein, partial [Oscillospiraceae bacterium]
KLKDMTGPDDYASMAQVITRRFTHYKNGDDNWSEKPDLLLIDGGSVHAKTAADALGELGLSVPAFGMVKDDRHRTRALAAPDGREIGIQQNQALFALVGTIQEETHRFAIEFGRAQHAQKVKGSVLDNIPGVGPKRRADLLKHFKSVRKIKAASLAELEEAVDKRTAKAVYDFFKEDPT